MNHQVWNDVINNNNFIINSKKIRVFPILKKNKDYDRLKIDNDSFNFITIREISNLITKIICKHLICNNINPLNTLVVDSTAGVGGNTLSFLKFFKKVIAIEICQIRHEYLVNNINIYEHDNVECLNMSFCEYYKDNITIENPDVIFMDPPWGGIGYKNLNNLQLSLDDIHIEDIVINALKRFKLNDDVKKTKLFVLKLPKNYDIEYFYERLNNEKNEGIDICIFLYVLSKMLLVVCEFKYSNNEKQNIT